MGTLLLSRCIKKSWHFLEVIKIFGIYHTIYYLCKLKMDKEQIQAILDNGSEEFFERFFETLLEEINSDDEPYHKKARHLFLAALKSEDPDDFFISLCGWSLEGIINHM